MPWFRVDDTMPEHQKWEELERLGPRRWSDAMAVWIVAGCYCARNTTDGFVSSDRLPRLSILGAKANRAAEDLVRVGLWKRAEGGYRFHDWADFQPTKAELEEAKKLKTERQRRWRKRARLSKIREPVDAPQDGLRDALQDASRDASVDGDGSTSRVDAAPSRPVPSQKKEKSGETPAPPSPPLDPFMDSLTSKPPGKREDVAQVHAAWKLACNFPGHRFRGAFDADARIIAEAIDTYSLADCILVAKHAPQDGMVSGKADDKGRKHDRIRYIFGNNDAFNRILRVARERQGQDKRKRPASEVVAEARALAADDPAPETAKLMAALTGGAS